MTPQAYRSRLILCLAIVYLVWGSSYLATRIGVSHLPPLLFGGIRFTLAGVIMLLVAAWRGFRPAQMAGEWRHVAVLGLIGVSVVNGLQVWALQWLPSQTGALLNASCAFWIVLFGLFGRRAHQPSLRALTGVVIGFVGTALLVWPATHAAPGGPDANLVPQLAVLLACVFWAIATIYLRNAHSRLDVLSLTGAQMLIGGIALVAGGLLRGELAAWHWSLPGLLSMAWLTIFSACIAYTAYAWLARHAAPAVVGTYGYVNPMIATLLGYLVLDERLDGIQVVGTGVILAGVLLVNWPSKGTIDDPTTAI
jgi:drug/metabolite transporter (DMT)-like permease